MRKRNVVKAAIVGAALALVIPGIAYAATTATVSTPGASSWTAPGAGVLLKTDAQCSSGLASGGGVLVTGSGTQQQIDGIHVMESTPSTNGTSEASNGATSPTYWLGYGGTGGQGGGNYTVTPYAICFTGNSSITSTQVVVNSVNGPTGTSLPSAMATATATCPANTVLLGGGVASTLASNKSVKAIASYPSNSSGAAATDGSTNPTSWTAVALNGGMSGTNNTTAAYAVCTGNTNPGVTVTVKHTNNSTGPNTASTTATATTAACGTAGSLISGGGSISGSDPTTGSFIAPGSQGDHLDGLYPSDSSGNATGNGNSTDRFTALAHAGGMSSTGNNTDVWGLCLP